MNRRQAAKCLAALAAAAPPSWRAASASEQKYPDVVSARVRAASDNTFDFDVTVSSSYDSPRRYADGIRARSQDGVVYGERKLLHDHANEQPFTRDMYGVRVPSGVKTVIVEARDQVHGYGGRSVEVRLPRR